MGACAWETGQLENPGALPNTRACQHAKLALPMAPATDVATHQPAPSDTQGNASQGRQKNQKHWRRFSAEKNKNTGRQVLQNKNRTELIVDR
jgi:hypothetical protein